MTVQRHRGLTEQAADAAIDTACRMLRLPTIRAQFPDLATTAAREQMTYRGFLAELLMAECDDRARRRSDRRIKAARGCGRCSPGRWATVPKPQRSRTALTAHRRRGPGPRSPSRPGVQASDHRPPSCH